MTIGGSSGDYRRQVATKDLFSKNNKSSGDWNKYYVMEIALFFTGFCLHLGCEFTGINKWYCKHGNACSK